MVAFERVDNEPRLTGASRSAPESVESLVHELKETAARGDVKGVLARLNERTRYRFTGLYRIETPHLRNICLFDRENPGLTVSGAICPLDDTYCAIVAATDCPFTTADSADDSRLVNHAARDRVVSYAGVPLMEASGARGTLCHFDFRPRLLNRGEIGFLEAVSPLLAEFLTAPTAN